MGADVYSLKILAPYCQRFARDSVFKIFSQRVTDSVTWSINYKGVCRTAPVTQGLLITLDLNSFLAPFNLYQVFPLNHLIFMIYVQLDEL